jgi:catecholate siderophore receptor
VTERFEALTGIRVVLAHDLIRDLPSPGVTGVMAPEEALAQSLVGTGVSFVTSARDTVTLDIRTAEFVTVESHGAAVTSATFTQALLDIPQTITVVPKEIIQAQGATTLRDVLRNVPGITFQAGEGGGGLPGENFTIRGFSAGNDMFVDACTIQEATRAMSSTSNRSRSPRAPRPLSLAEVRPAVPSTR